MEYHDPSLFGLISLAGNASLGELRARGSVDSDSLAHQLADLLRDGSVSLTVDPDVELDEQVPDPDSSLGTVLDLIRDPKSNGLDRLLVERNDVFRQAIHTALKDDKIATSIIVNPTSKGFRRRL